MQLNCEAIHERPEPPDFKLVEAALYDWARWMRGYGRIGIPVESIIGRLVRLGAGAGPAENIGSPSDPIPEYIETIDLAILAIPAKPWRDVVINQWIRKLPDKDSAKRLHSSVRTISAWRVHGYCFLKGRLAL